MTTFYPSLRYDDAPAAIEWLERAFGFEREMVVEEGEGRIAHAQLRYGDGMVMLGSERDDGWGPHAGRSWVYVAVEDDVDAHYERAKAAGAEVVREPTDQDYGSRDYSVRDPEGNIWSFGTYRP
jgi:uncharacterized glyoxalase superfamily protein PhnB